MSLEGALHHLMQDFQTVALGLLELGDAFDWAVS